MLQKRPEYKKLNIYPTHFTRYEGDEWIKISIDIHLPNQPYAIKYSNGKIWDREVGWREKE